MNKLPLILIGGGGHCRSCIDVIELEGKYKIEGILDTKEAPGQQIDGYPVLGNDNLMEELVKKGYHFLITIGQIKSACIRVGLFEKLQQKNAKLATVISPKAYVSRKARVGLGTVVLHNTIVNAGSTIGNNVILNTGCLVEHDVKVGDHVHISTRAVLNGAVVVNNNCFVGSCGVIVQTVTIAKDVIIGAGSVVVTDIISAGTYVGNPAKKLT